MADGLQVIARRPSPPPSRAGAAGEGRRRAIEALVELLEEVTWDAISVSDVVERAAMSRSTFYAHFVDRWDVMAAALPEVLGGSTGPGDAPVDLRALLERAAGMRSMLAPVLGEPSIDHVHRLARDLWRSRAATGGVDAEDPLVADLMAGVLVVVLRRVVARSRPLAAADAHAALMAADAAIRSARAPVALRRSA